jgi:hypothetical protein
MARWITDMAYDDDDCPEAPGIEYNPDPELAYLRAFWYYVTEDLTLNELRQVNDHLDSQFDFIIPQEYYI